jgi:hypothetical protein
VPFSSKQAGRNGVCEPERADSRDKSAKSCDERWNLYPALTASGDTRGQRQFEFYPAPMPMTRLGCPRHFDSLGTPAAQEERKTLLRIAAQEAASVVKIQTGKTVETTIDLPNAAPMLISDLLG